MKSAVGQPSYRSHKASEKRLTGMRNTNTETKRRHARSCASVELYAGTISKRLLVQRAEPRISNKLTIMDPRMDDCTTRTWSFIKAILSLLDGPISTPLYSRRTHTLRRQSALLSSLFKARHSQDDQLYQVAQADVQQSTNGIAGLTRNHLGSLG